MTYPPATLGHAVLYVFLFGLLAIALLMLGFKVFEWVTPRLDVEGELTKNNTAVAIVTAAFVLGLSWIIVTAMS